MKSILLSLLIVRLRFRKTDYSQNVHCTNARYKMKRIQTIKHPKFFTSMKRLILVLAGMVFSLAASAQTQAVTLNLEVDDSPCNGESFCVDVSVDDWTDIILLQTFIEWDPAVLRFDGVQGFNLTQLGIEDFDVSNSSTGRIFFNWDDIPCGSNGITLEDGTVIFQLCFTAIGAYGDTTQLIIPDNEQVDGIFYPRAFKNSTCSAELNVFVNSVGGVVSTCVNPVKVIGSQETGFEDELVCVSFNVEGFEDLTTMQFSLNWDPNQLQFENVLPNDNIRNLGPESFGLPTEPNIGPGNMTVSWSFANFNGDGITLPDGTEFFQICFRIIGECETEAVIGFSGNPTPVEITNTVVEGTNIVFVPEEGSIQIGQCDPTGLTLIANCPPPANLNDEVCVGVTTTNFNGITELQNLIQWNANILQFKEIRNVSASVLGLGNSFDETNVGNGILGIDFTSPVAGFGSTLTPGGSGKLFDVCFDVVGLGGNSPFNFKGAPQMIAKDRDNGSNNIGVNPTSCEVEIIQPAGMTMLVSDGAARPGESVCLDVAVNNFSDITNLEFSFGWESNIAVFKEIRGLSLSGANITDFGSGFSFEWSGSPTTLSNGEILFQVCLDIVGAPDECDPDVGLINLPIAPKVITSTSNDESIGLTAQNGEVCVLFPEGFFMNIGDVEGDIRDTVCVPFKVASFDNITQAQFSVTWDASAMLFTEVTNLANLPGLSQSSFNSSAAFVGLLDLDWSDGSGQVLADSTVLFEVCYELLGPPDDCYEISVSEQPEPAILTTNGNADIVVDPGEVCINNRLFIDAIVTNVTCPGGSDGSVELVTSGGRGPIAFNWEIAPPQFGPNARNLSEGKVMVTVFDNSNPPLILRDTFEIGVSGGNLPVANAGTDQTLACEGAIQFAFLEGSGSVGPEYSYTWFVNDGGNIQGNRNAPTVTAASAGTYILQVLNTETGCTARDTALVIASELPMADAGQDQIFTCETTSLRLNGSLSSSGPDISYSWTATNGGDIQDGEENQNSPLVNAPGTYILSVKNNTDGCEVIDSVTIQDLTGIPPIANAGPDMVLGCEGSNVILNPVSTGGAVSFEWQTIDQQFLTNEPQFTVNEPGSFILKVTDEITSCTNFDTISITRQEVIPIISVEVFEEITCARDTVSIFGSVENADVFRATWTALDENGSIFDGFQDSLSTFVRTAGDYRLVVSNLENNCRDSIDVTVNENTQAPVSEAGAQVILDCDNPSRTLDGANSSIGSNFTYEWLRGDTFTISNTITANVEIPGNYFLKVTDSNNGCESVDSVTVDVNGEQPQIIIEDFETEINCRNSSLQINASVTGTVNFEFEWVVLGDTGNIVSGLETLMPVVDKPGVYQLRVRDTDTGCPGINEAIVRGSIVPPFTEAGEEGTFTCSNDFVVLDGSASARGVGISYAWTSLEGGEVLSTDTTSASVSGPGLYQLAVTSSSTGCIGLDTVRVVADTTVPVISFLDPEQLLIGCGDSTVIIDASRSRPGGDFFVNWNVVDGDESSIIDRSVNLNPLKIEVNQPGIYEIVVINNESLCESSATVEVKEAEGAPPIEFATSPQVSCVAPTVQLDATPTNAFGSFTTQWNSIDQGNSVVVDPNNPLLANASGAGMYELILTIGTGCESRDTIEVLPTADEPEVMVSETDLTIECGQTVTLDGSGSSEGGTFEIQWSEINGSVNIPDPDNLTITVNQAGTYRLLITNSANGCADSASVNVVLNTAGLPSADAGADASTCEPVFTLIGNIPDNNTTGMWKALDSGDIETPDELASEVLDLDSGNNRFVWSLSKPGCPDFSSDTIQVFLESTPLAVDDAFKVNSRQNNLAVDLLNNDNLNGIADFTFEITSSPSLGDLSDIGVGNATYNLKQDDIFGVDQFTYTICNSICPNLCDDASVQVTIEEAVVTLDSLSVPNGITPNGDGMNDALIFEILEEFPDVYKDNEMTIFNRWGDIIYEAKPYLNDWAGTNSSGQELPHGTYYYILRLDIPNGVIIKGDVTIVK